MINTVLGQINESEVKSALSHEHITCYCDFMSLMSGEKYIDKAEVEKAAVSHLIYMREKYGLNLFLDCTPANIGRDVELMKRVSEKSGVHIVCSTGLYYTYNPIIAPMSAENIAEHYIRDAKNINAGIIKAAVEEEKISEFNEKLLVASAIAHKEIELPIVVHTNGRNENGRKALEILLENGASPESVVIGHIGGSGNADYICEMAQKGCYVAFDRLPAVASEEYLENKVAIIERLCEAGFGEKILLSHDAMYFTGFSSEHKIQPEPRFEFVYKNLLPRLDASLADTIMRKNPVSMLKCKRNG